MVLLRYKEIFRYHWLKPTVINCMRFAFTVIIMGVSWLKSRELKP